MKIVKFLVVVVIASFTLFSCDQTNTNTETVTVLSNGVDSVSYALGVNIGENIKNSGFDEINIDQFARALKEVYNGDSVAFNSQEAMNVINAYMMGLSEKKAQAAKDEAVAFLSKNAENPNVVTTASGLQYEVLEEGTGVSPTLQDMVTVHYHGTLLDGTVFDSSVERGEPTSFPLNGVIQGWQEGLQTMKEGGKTKFYIPSDLGYGDQGTQGVIGPGDMLIFEVELIKVGE